MLNRLKAWLSRATEDRGAADPILVVASVAVSAILLVGGTLAVAGFISFANNNAAQGDLDRLSQAQSSFFSENDRYGSFAMGPDIDDTNTELADASQSYMSSEGVNVKVRSSAGGWVAVAGSKSGEVYLRTSDSPKNHQLAPSATTPQYGTPVEVDRNYFRNSGTTRTTDLQAPTVSSAAVTGTAIGAASWSPSGSSFRTTLSAVGTQPSRQVAMQTRIFNSFESAGVPMVGETVTMTAQLRSSQPFALHSIVPVSTAGATRAPIAATLPQTVPANTTVFAYITFMMTAEDYGSASRVNFFVGNMAVGQTIEMSAIDLYRGPYDSMRTWFSGSSPADGSMTHAWSGTSGLSASIRYKRPILLAQPAGVTFPSGITWADVAADVALVSQK